MKKSIITGVFGLLLSLSLHALDAHISYATFKGIDNSNFIEVYLQVKGNSITFKKADEVYKAEVAVQLLFLQDDKIIDFDKYILKSPEGLTDIRAGVSLIDMKRLAIPEGEYDLEITLKDLYDPENVAVYNQKVRMGYGDSEVQISDIQLLEGYAAVEPGSNSLYVKHGYFLKPYTYPVYPSFVNGLTFFAEIYNT
ncbi:MAG: hypothetical protein AAFV80_11790, partial [Bacteroidota bacterium]